MFAVRAQAEDTRAALQAAQQQLAAARAHAKRAELEAREAVVAVKVLQCPPSGEGTGSQQHGWSYGEGQC